MSAVALSLSLKSLPSSAEPLRDPGRQPSGASSFSAILKGIDQQDAASGANASSVGAAEIVQGAPAGQEGMAQNPTRASDPFSIEAGLAALGYGSFEDSPVSEASGSTRIGAAAPQSRAAASSRIDSAPSGPAAANPAVSLASPAIAPSRPTTSDLSSTAQGGAANGQTQKTVAGAQIQAGPSPRTSSGLAALIAASEDAAPSDATAGQIAAADDSASTSARSPIETGLAPLGYGPVGASQGASASGQTRKAVAGNAVSPSRTYPSAGAPSAGSVSRGAAGNGQAQTGVAASRTQADSLSGAALGDDASGASQGALPSGAASRDVAAQTLLPSQVLGSQSFVSQPAAANGATQPAAAAAQSPIGPQSRTGPRLAALSGATDVGAPTVANAPASSAANPLTADPALGLQSLQSRTHLAMTNAMPVRTSATAPTSAAAAPAAAPATSTSTNANSGDRQPSGERAPPPVPTPPGSSIAAAGPGLLDPGSTGLASIPVNGLGDFLAEQASSLTEPSAPSAAPRTPTIAAPQAVKELEISLDPANLGAVSVKMRLANGKLSVVIGASSSTTLSAIENERGAIAARLGSSEQPLESLAIVSREPSNESSKDFAQTASGGNDASDQANRRQAKSNDNSSGAQRSDGGVARARTAASSAAGSTNSTAGGGRGDMLV